MKRLHGLILGAGLLLAGCGQNASTPTSSATPAKTSGYGDGVDHRWTASQAEGQRLYSTLSSTLKAQEFNVGVFITATSGWGPIELNTSNGETAAGDGHPITLQGQVYPTGLGVHADSEIHIHAIGFETPACTRFTSDIGVDDEVGEHGQDASVIFQVYADGEKLYDSGIMTGESVTKHIDVAIGNKSDLRFVVTKGLETNYYDHADWAGASISCSAVPQTSGTVVAWGDNSNGQTSVPAGLTNVTAIAAGGYHSLALKTDGTVVAWGVNNFGQTYVPAGLTNVKAVAAGFVHSLALKNDGTVVAWGDNRFGQASVPAGLTNVMAIAAGQEHSLALKTDGTVVAWGTNDYGQTSVPARLTNVKAIAAAGYESLALKTDGTVVAWGTNYNGQVSVPAGLTDVKAIAAGDNHNLALKTDGTVVAWGYNQFGQTDVPTGLMNVKALAAGYYHSLALKTDGTVVAWGSDYYGQTSVPAGLANVKAIAAGGVYNLALRQEH